MTTSNALRGHVLGLMALLAALLLPASAIAQDITQTSTDEREGAESGQTDVDAEESGEAETVASPESEPAAENEEVSAASESSENEVVEPEPVVTPPTPEAPADEAPTPEQVDAGPQLKVTGSFFSRFEERRRGDVGSDIVRYRSRLGLATTPIGVSENLDVVLRFVGQAGGRWNVGGNTLGDVGLGLHEGVLELHGDQFRIDVGRFEMAYGDELVIGSVGWHELGRAFDGVRFHLTGKSGYWVDTFATLLEEGAESDAPKPGVSDQYFTGIYVGLGELVKPGFNLDAYVLGNINTRQHNPLDATEPLSDAGGFATVGARVKNKEGALDYRIEVGAQAGKVAGSDILAFQGDAELGYTVGIVRLALEGLYASGDDPDTADKNEAYNQLYPTGHKWLGYADFFGARSNIAGGVFHLSVKLPIDLVVNFDAHSYWRPQPVVNPMSVPTDGFAGLEFDTGVVYTIGKGLKIRTNYSVAAPNEDMYGSDDLVHFTELELRYDLK